LVSTRRSFNEMLRSITSRVTKVLEQHIKKGGRMRDMQ
jgi:hypothetical protein